jgi:hypothetical protein
MMSGKQASVELSEEGVIYLEWGRLWDMLENAEK